MAQNNPVEQGITHLPDIPEELLSNILLRLTSKFVVRCKLVCKQWASLISDPFFVRSYISRSQSPSWTVIGERVKDRCIEYDLPKQICSRQDFNTLCLSIDHQREKNDEVYKVLGGDYGLILFGLVDHYVGYTYKSRSQLYYICNPLIRKVIPLSPPTPKSRTVEWLWGSGLVVHVENDVLESFRFVLLSPDLKTDRLRFRVYASETQEWSKHTVHSKVPVRGIFNALPTAFNQRLHWTTRDGYVIAYDPYAKRVRNIPPPKGSRARHKREFSCQCDVWEGKLRYLERFTVFAEGEYRDRFRLWAREGYGSAGSWVRLLVSDSTSVRFDGVVASPKLGKSIAMFFDPFDTDVLYLGHRNRFMSFNVRTRIFEVVKEYSYSNDIKNKMFPGYLAFMADLLPWPTYLGPCWFGPCCCS